MSFKDKEVVRKYQKEYRERNKERLMAQKLDYYFKNREILLLKAKERASKNLDKISLYHKKHYRNNKDKIKEYQKRYNELNKDKVKANKRIYYLSKQKLFLNRSKEYGKKYRKTETHKLLHVIRQHRRRIKIKEVSMYGNFTKDDWIALKTKNNNACVECKKVEPDIKLTVDHIIPISKGGTNDICNIQPLCISCNCSKGSKVPTPSTSTTTSTTTSDTIN